MENYVSILNVSTMYKKNLLSNKKTLENISLSIKKGEIVGIVGPNGSGKSTLMKAICGVIEFTNGEISLNGFSIKGTRSKYLNQIGELIEQPTFYSDLSGRINLKIFSEYYENFDFKSQSSKVIASLDMHEYIDNKVKTYSIGMKQRLGVALATIHNPNFLVLDEPINGLDPKGIIEIQQYLKELSERSNITILITSHILKEMSSICDRVAFMQKGKIVHIVNLHEKYFQNNTFHCYKIECNQIDNCTLEMWKEHFCIYHLEDFNIVYVCADTAENLKTLQLFSDYNFKLLNLSFLEDLYMTIFEVKT